MCTVNKYRIIDLRHNSADGQKLEAKIGYSKPGHEIEKIYGGNPNFYVEKN